jgi:hypothetical protein
MSFLVFTALSSCCVHSSSVLTGQCNFVDDVHKILTEYDNRDNFCCYGELGDILQFILGGSSSIQVARDEDLEFQIGKEIHFDLVDHDKVRSFRIQKQTLFSQFKVRNWLQLPILCLFKDTCKLLFLSHHLHHSRLFYHSQVQDFFLLLEEDGLSSPV